MNTYCSLLIFFVQKMKLNLFKYYKIPEIKPSFSCKLSFTCSTI